jgi:hypothetical protein
MQPVMVVRVIKHTKPKYMKRTTFFYFILIIAAAMLLPSSLQAQVDTSRQKQGREELKRATAVPQTTKGAPYPPAKPLDRNPNAEMKSRPVPTGKLVGDMKPLNAAIKIYNGRQKKRPNSFQQSLSFKDYREQDNSIPSASGCCPEMSVAENGQTIITTGNTWMSLSVNGGTSFISINPSTIFPQDDGGFCCDQVVHYIPKFDIFVWLLQYWSDAKGKNRIRIAAQSTADVRSSNGTSWTYWDFPSDVFSTTGSLDYSDVAWGNDNLWWACQNDKGRVVSRIPLKELAAKTTVHFDFAPGTDALWSHVTQNATNTVYWAGHVSNSELRVYDMKDGNGFYSWRSVTINSWPNGTNTSKCPDGSDWLTPFEDWKHYVFGNTLQRERVWFSWLAAPGGGFPQSHVQMVKINPSTWTKDEQVQIWNPDFAFMDAYLSTNNQGQIGMAVAFGGGPYYPSNAVGVWGDFVVYYPRLSTRCVGRWGDYNHSRRCTANGADWVAGGYTNEKDGMGNNIVIPHYIRFGR